MTAAQETFRVFSKGQDTVAGSARRVCMRASAAAAQSARSVEPVGEAGGFERQTAEIAPAPRSLKGNFRHAAFDGAFFGRGGEIVDPIVNGGGADVTTAFAAGILPGEGGRDDRSRRFAEEKDRP